MNKYYFTFGGFNHYLLTKKCVIIEANTELEAREVMFDKFSTNWGFVYDNKPHESVIEFDEALYLNEQFINN